MPKCLSHHASIIVIKKCMWSIALYKHGHQWFCCLPFALFHAGPFALFHAGAYVMWGDAWLVSILLNNAHIVQTAGYGTHVWNYIMSSCRKMHDPYKFEEAFNLLSKGVSCERISRILYIYGLEYYVHGRSVDLIALFHISNGLATFFIFR